MNTQVNGRSRCLSCLAALAALNLPLGVVAVVLTDRKTQRSVMSRQKDKKNRDKNKFHSVMSCQIRNLGMFLSQKVKRFS